MSEADAFVSEAQARVADLIRSAFEAGREIGRVEATRELKTKLFGVLNEGADKLPEAATAEQIALEQSVEEIADYAASGDKPQSRAAPGSVKPTILKLLSETHDGLDMQAVADQTGIKFNSVRGTLYALASEGVAERREGRWFFTEQHRLATWRTFMAAQNNEASDVEPEGAPSEASHDSPREPGAALRPVEPVPGGDT